MLNLNINSAPCSRGTVAIVGGTLQITFNKVGPRKEVFTTLLFFSAAQKVVGELVFFSTVPK
jgi:hypothetical protein